MKISPETISICLELISSVSVPPAADDAVAKMQMLVSARKELLAALPREDDEAA